MTAVGLCGVTTFVIQVFYKRLQCHYNVATGLRYQWACNTAKLAVVTSGPVLSPSWQ